MGEWNHHYGSLATEKKVLVGAVTKFYSRLSVGEIAVQANTFKKGDKLLITGPTTGAMYLDATEIHDDNGAIEEAVQGTRVSVPVPGKVRKNDKVFRIDKVKEE